MAAEENREALLAALGDAIREYQRGVDAIDEAVAEGLGVNRTDLRAIDVLSEGGPRSAGELAARVGLSPAAMTTALDRLEKKGHVRRVRDGADRRKVLVEITEEATRKAWEAIGPIVADGAGILEPFTTPELATIVEFLRSACELNERHVARIRGLGRS
jgi:DNA-binding MarR family transcriptional regulator